MRKLIINTFVTLDGVMRAPGDPEEDPTGGFVHGGWSVNYWDEMMMKIMNEALAKPYDLLLGRKTYEIFAAHWPFVKNDSDVLNQMAAASACLETAYCPADGISLIQKVHHPEF